MGSFDRPQLLPRPARQGVTGRRAAHVCGRTWRGFSLVEAVVATGIVAVMLVASMNLLGSAAKSRGFDNDRRTALMLAHQLMGEIQQQPYKDESMLALLFGPEAGELAAPSLPQTRAGFDDVDDYNNWQDRPPQLKDGTALAGYDGWKRKVKVSWINPTTLADSAIDTGLERIEVRVTDPKDRETVVYALRSAYMTPDPPASGTTALLWTGVELDAGGDTPRRTTAGIPLVTRPTTP
jgi:type II secretory pathway pseudopilin PulG